MSEGAPTAYLFQCNARTCSPYRMTERGPIIPRTAGTLGWTFTRFPLGHARIILQGIATSGYFIWRGSSFRTAQ